MNRFADLYDRVSRAARPDVQARLIAAYLAATPDPDRGWALGILVGAVDLKRGAPARLRALTKDHLDPELFALSHDFVGDLAETVALMWTAAPGANRPPPLADIVEGACAPLDDATLARWLDALEPRARWVLLRLVCGPRRAVATMRVARDAVVRLGDRTIADVEAAWHAVAPPYENLLAWAEGREPRPAASRRAAFRQLASTRTVDAAPNDLFAMGAWTFDVLWDGVRALAISAGDDRALYSAHGDDISAGFPDILDALSVEAAMDGVIQLVGPDGIQADKGAVRKRIASPRSARRDGFAAVLRAVDLLAQNGEDLTDAPFATRRAQLDMLAPSFGPAITIAPLLEPRDAAALDVLRNASEPGRRGVALRRADAAVGDSVSIWPRARATATFALLYVEASADAIRCTLGTRGDDGALVPVGTVDVDGETGDRIDAFARDHAIDRFGPVTQVAADDETCCALTVAFDGVVAAPRRKAGLVLRAPTLISVVEDGSLGDVAALDGLRRDGAKNPA